ncbi:hypothetical protein EON80_12595 [bacterium]|nr:MAG: hypothetical protein EON80_12595 [bacterium]
MVNILCRPSLFQRRGSLYKNYSQRLSQLSARPSMTDDGQLFHQLATQARAAYEEDKDQSELFWDIVWMLSYRGDRETLEATLPLTRGDVFERKFAAAILGPFAPRVALEIDDIIRTPRRFASEQIIDVLLEMLVSETNEAVLGALVSSLGQYQELDIRIPAAIGQFLQYPNIDIRWSLAVGLARYDTPETTRMLIVLSSDRDASVRQWATFGLASLSQENSPEVRAALLARLKDKKTETRIEAIEGLALRRDLRVVPAVKQEFDDSANAPWKPTRYLPSERLMEALGSMANDPVFGSERAQVQGIIAHCQAYIGSQQQLVCGSPA